MVFWFDGKAFRHQAYDVRKGQYTRAVDDWVNRIEFSPSGYVMPGTMATVREVYLKDEPGATEAEKLDAAILRARKAMANFDASRIKAPALPSSRGDLTRAPDAGLDLPPGLSRPGPRRPVGPLRSVRGVAGISGACPPRPRRSRTPMPGRIPEPRRQG